MHKDNQRLCFSILLSTMLLMLTSVINVQAQDVQAVIDKGLRNLPSNKAEFGIYIKNLTTGQTVVMVNENRKFIPASNQKIVTTAAAPTVLGTDFNFTTRLLMQGKDLVLVGDGDPSSADPKFLKRKYDHLESDGARMEAWLKQWVDAVKKTGRNEFDILYVDDRIFDIKLVHDDWPTDQLNKWYVAEVAGININNNCLDVYASPTKEGYAPRLRVIPNNPPVEMIISARTGTRNALWASRKYFTNQINIRGTVKASAGTPIYVTFHDPPMFAAQLLQRRLAKAGIQVKRVTRPDGEWTIAENARLLFEEKNPLFEIMRRCNEDSQNLFAECILKRMGREATGRPGGWLTGASAVRTFLSQRLGSTAADFVISDGSGMSRENKVTPKAMVMLLESMYRDRATGPMFIRSLSVAHNQSGIPARGQMTKRFKGYQLEAVVRAKSGYLRGTLALSGYMHYEKQTLAFSIFINDFDKPVYKGKQWIESIVTKTDSLLTSGENPAYKRIPKPQLEARVHR